MTLPNNNGQYPEPEMDYGILRSVLSLLMMSQSSQINTDLIIIIARMIILNIV